MSSTILQTENKTPQLLRLAAQRQIYSEVKWILAAQMIAAVPVVVVLAFLTAVFPSLKVYATGWGLLVTLADITILSPLQAKRKQLAAKIQEQFDCDVLGLPWHDLKAGSKPDPESVHQYAERYKRVHPKTDKLQDWYPPVVERLPLEFGRIVCQRTNCWWDASLRRRYANVVLGILILLATTVGVLGVRTGITMSNFLLSVVGPLLPAVSLGVKLVKEQHESANAVDRLKDHAERLWKEALSGRITGGDLLRAARDLQDEIFDHRRKSTPVPDFIYKLLRDSYQEGMNVGAAEMVAEFENTYDK